MYLSRTSAVLHPFLALSYCCGISEVYQPCALSLLSIYLSAFPLFCLPLITKSITNGFQRLFHSIIFFFLKIFTFFFLKISHAGIEWKKCLSMRLVRWASSSLIHFWDYYYYFYFVFRFKQNKNKKKELITEIQ